LEQEVRRTELLLNSVADRLHLRRIGVTPNPGRLSTADGRARIGWARAERQLWHTWDAICTLAGWRHTPAPDDIASDGDRF